VYTTPDWYSLLLADAVDITLIQCNIFSCSKLIVNKLSAGAMSPKLGNSHLLKRYAPELLSGVVFNMYD